MARTIQDLFAGDMTAFLDEEIVVFDDIRTILTQQFVRLSPLEREILIWLAVEREAIALDELAQNLIWMPARRDLLEALRALQRRSLLEKRDTGFTLQNVVTEFLIDYLVTQIGKEIEQGARNGQAAPLAGTPHTAGARAGGQPQRTDLSQRRQ